MDIIEKLAAIIIVPIMLFMLYVILVWLPVHLSNESDCLESGYPKTSTSFNLKGYCLNIDGDVTGTVKPLQTLNKNPN